MFVSMGGPVSRSRVPGAPLYTTDINSKYDPNTTFVLNPAAWTNPAPGQFGGVAVLQRLPVSPGSSRKHEPGPDLHGARKG